MSEVKFMEIVKWLEAATGPCRGLDCDIARELEPLQTRPFVGPSTWDMHKGMYWVLGKKDTPNGHAEEKWSKTAPRFTESIDAALTLVPEDCDFYFEVEQVMGGFANYLYVTGGGAIAPSHDLRGKGGKLHKTWKEAVAALPREISATALKARASLNLTTEASATPRSIVGLSKTPPPGGA